MKFYTIRHIKSGYLPDLYVSSNGDDAEFCNSTSVSLSFSESPCGLWSTSNKEYVEKVLVGVKWYNSCIEYPEMPDKFIASDYEIVEFNL